MKLRHFVFINARQESVKGLIRWDRKRWEKKHKNKIKTRQLITSLHQLNNVDSRELTLTDNFSSTYLQASRMASYSEQLYRVISFQFKIKFPIHKA